MKALLNRLIQHETINREEARQALVSISRGEANTSQIAAFLTVYMMRSVTVEELEGFRDALLELCIPAGIDASGAIDLCGTGGDGKDTFNVSTLASFVTAAAGIPVVKHGNYGVSSTCGSSNVLEHLGIRFSNDSEFLQRCLDESGVCILHAPLFHPAMKHVAPIRRELAVKTFFNMLGPMVNPARPSHQMVGVFSLELARLYNYLYQNTNITYHIVHALDGYDEISLTGGVKVIGTKGEQLLEASHFGANPTRAEEIAGGTDVAGSAQIFMDVLKGKGSTPQNEVVAANAALAIHTVQGIGLKNAFEQSLDLLRSGKAFHTFSKLQELSRVYA